MTFLPPNLARGFVGLAGLILMVAGAGAIWGWAVAAFACGLFLLIDAASDEMVERFTGITRWRPAPDAPDAANSTAK